MTTVFKSWDAFGRERSDDAEPPDGGGEPPGASGGAAGDPWADPPFVPMGKSGRKFHFIDATGEIVEFAASALGQWTDLVALCGGEEWLLRHFRAHDRDGVALATFSARKAGAAIIAHSTKLDVFDPNEPRRRYGLWKLPEGMALHAGRTVLWVDGGRPQQRAAGFRDAGALWPVLPARPLPPMPARMASAELGRALEAKLATWNWESPHGPALMLGGAVVGMLGTVAPWRAHLAVVGEPGCGKSTLLGLLIAGLCPLTVYRNDYTEPGLRQMLSETAAGVILDEAESDAGGETKLQRVIEMLRRASGGAGVQSVKGGADHHAVSFTVTTSAILGCVWPPALNPQDESRFTVLQLLPLGETREDEASIAAFAREHGAALWGRAIGNAARVVSLFRLLRARLRERGYSPRVADQLGMLAAARWVMVRDPEEDPAGATADDGADEPLACVEALMVRDDDRITDSGPNLCLQHLLATAMDMAGNRLTIGQGLSKLRKAADVLRRLAVASAAVGDNVEREAAIGDLNAMRALLAAHGVAWGSFPLRAEDNAPPPPMGLYVSVNAHPKLARAFDGTNWTGKRWGAALARLPGAKSGREVGPVRMGGHKPRCVWVPAETLARLIE